MLGLHNVPLTVGAVSIVLCIALVGGYAALRRKEPEFAGIAGGFFALAVMATVLGGGGFTWFQENSLDKRDQAIEARLAQADIRIADNQAWSWDERIAVRKGSCTASFTVQAAADLTNSPNTWPLVEGTGRVVDGDCVDLDKHFR